MRVILIKESGSDKVEKFSEGSGFLRRRRVLRRVRSYEKGKGLRERGVIL